MRPDDTRRSTSIALANADADRLGTVATKRVDRFRGALNLRSPIPQEVLKCVSGEERSYQRLGMLDRAGAGE